QKQKPGGGTPARQIVFLERAFLLRLARADHPAQRLKSSERNTEKSNRGSAIRNRRRRDPPSNVHWTGISVRGDDVSDEDVTGSIWGGHISNCRVGNMEDDRGVKCIRRTTAARGTVDPERKHSGAIPIERAGFCGQGLGGILIDGDIPHGNSGSVEFEGL